MRIKTYVLSGFIIIYKRHPVDIFDLWGDGTGRAQAAGGPRAGRSAGARARKPERRG